MKTVKGWRCLIMLITVLCGPKNIKKQELRCLLLKFNKTSKGRVYFRPISLINICLPVSASNVKVTFNKREYF